MAQPVEKLFESLGQAVWINGSVLEQTPHEIVLAFSVRGNPNAKIRVCLECKVSKFITKRQIDLSDIVDEACKVKLGR